MWNVSSSPKSRVRIFRGQERENGRTLRRHVHMPVFEQRGSGDVEYLLVLDPRDDARWDVVVELAHCPSLALCARR